MNVANGQAYKNGSNSGVFLQITCDDANDLQTPNHKYSSGVVKAAQARGGFSVLVERERRALRVHLVKATEDGLKAAGNKQTTQIAQDFCLPSTNTGMCVGRIMQEQLSRSYCRGAT